LASARESILILLDDLHECIIEQSDECRIEYVYVLGGLDSPGNSLADLGTRVTNLWENETHQLITEQQPADKIKLLLEFLERKTYVHLNMNVPELKKLSNDGFQTDSTGLTITAESINDFRRISILLYAHEIPVAI